MKVVANREITLLTIDSVIIHLIGELTVKGFKKRLLELKQQLLAAEYKTG